MTVSRHPEFADRHLSRRHQRHRGTSGRSSISSVPLTTFPSYKRSAQQLPLPLKLPILSSPSENCRLAIYLPTPPFQRVDLVSIPPSDFTYSRRYLLAQGTWAQRLHAFRAAQVQSESTAAEAGLVGGEVRALALVDFLARTDAESGEHALMRETGDVALEAMRACSATLAAPGLRRLGEADALGWLAYWRGVGWV